ncbi:MAG: carboxypeptidase-like regulatory domain-containing protein [Bacteroidia bacterium]
MKKILITILLTLTLSFVFAQKTNQADDDLVQFTGFVLSVDSTKTIPFVTIKVIDANRGTYSDMQGYFSFVAKKTDIVTFTCVGYKPVAFAFPENIEGYKFNAVITLEEDTFYLPEFVKRSYPTPEEFDYMLTKGKVPMDELSIAQYNLRRQHLREISMNLSNDGIANANWTFGQYADRAYYNGQPQPIRVLDPLAWGKFIKAIENGDFKRK